MTESKARMQFSTSKVIKSENGEDAVDSDEERYEEQDYPDFGKNTFLIFFVSIYFSNQSYFPLWSSVFSFNISTEKENLLHFGLEFIFN